MKKIWMIVFALTCLLGLTACDPGWNAIDADEVLRNTEKIELVYYENENPKTIRMGKKDTPVFDFSKTTLITTLDESHIEDVVRDIASDFFTVYGRYLNEPIGKTMILYQSDGNMIVLFGCVYTNEIGGKRYYGQCSIFDENGCFVEYLGDISSSYVEELELKYFGTST